ncbi:iron reductase [Lentinus brumalis]|uniref:ferric-chelate reductase (NADPH) n=1 Tax=Lentinus brumalis TaxID=2498619 RepID=A0A371DA80_9APHY|nr:iron reductase [Polyporus brumalis]
MSATIDHTRFRPTTLEARAGPGPLNAAVVFWVDILLLCVVGLLFVLTLPRMLAHFSRGGGWRLGLLLRHTTATSHSDEQSVSSRRTLDRRSIITRTACSSSSENEKPAPTRVQATHVRSWQMLFPHMTHVLRLPVLGRIHLGGAVICVLYFSLLLFAALYRTSIWTNPVRAAYVAISQIPVVYLLATKNNVLGVLLGTAYDKLNYLHRFAGRLLVLAANVHAIGMIYRYTLQGRWMHVIAETDISWGLVSLVLLDILFLFSLDVVRRRMRNLFISTHVVASILFLVTVCLHMNAAVPYVIAGAVFYGLDRVLRMLKSRICTATLTCLPELHTTQVHIPKLNSGWRAGQHVRLRILSSGMGPYGWAEAHPYTIASASDGTVQEGIVLICKKAGSWTRRLYDIAAENRRGALGGSDVRVLVEGPYGGLGYTGPDSFSGSVFFAGGSGISYGLSGVQELLEHAKSGVGSVRCVDLVWSVHHPDCVRPILPFFAALLAESKAADIALGISVFYTRALTADHSFADLELPTGLSLTPGRPDVYSILVGLTMHATSSRDMFLGVCGPSSLGGTVRKAVRDVDNRRIPDTVGRFHLHEEIFSL